MSARRFRSLLTGRSELYFLSYLDEYANNDRVEAAVKQILCGLNVKTSASVANAECLDWYREWARTH